MKSTSNAKTSSINTELVFFLNFGAIQAEELIVQFQDQISAEHVGIRINPNISQDSSSSCLFSDEFVIIYKEIREAVHNE